VTTETMQAGRELDALVARDVFGWRVEFGESAEQRWAFVWVDGHEQPGEFRWWKGSEAESAAGWASLELPRYSTDIAAAWEVAERCGISVVRSEDGWYAVKPEDIQHGSLRGTAFPTITLVFPEMRYPEPSPTAPLAICRAALAALEASA
jgi:hypothetical protein